MSLPKRRNMEFDISENELSKDRLSLQRNRSLLINTGLQAWYVFSVACGESILSSSLYLWERRTRSASEGRGEVLWAGE